MFKSKFLKTTFSLFLCLTLLLSSITIVHASGFEAEEGISLLEEEYGLDFSYLDAIDGSTASLENDGALLLAAFNEMSPEAQAIFLQYLRSQDEELLIFYNTYVDTSANLEFEQALFVPYNTSVLNDISAQLIALGLSATVRTALMGAASSIVAAISTGGITPAAIVAILVAVSFSIVIIANWTEVSSKWSSIVNAFTTSFSYAITSTNMSSAWSQAKPTYQNKYTSLTGVRPAISSATFATSSARHIKLSVVQTISRSHTPVAVYTNDSCSTALFVYKLGSSMIANVNESFSHQGSETSGIYDFMNYLLPVGTKVYILLNLNTMSVFHAHLRTGVTDDTNAMRRANGLSWTVYPTIYYDSTYSVATNSFILSGKQIG